jgi:hypothetical protein
MLPFYIVRQNFSKKSDHATNNRVRRGEIANTSIILMVLKIRQNMEQGMVMDMATATATLILMDIMKMKSLNHSFKK